MVSRTDSSGRGRRWSIDLHLPWLTRALGRRRSWLLASQLAIIGGLIGMALMNPLDGLHALVWFALVVAFASATQDIALDAYRIESAAVEKQAALAAMYQTGYRLATIWAGAGVLWIAARAAGDVSAERLAGQHSDVIGVDHRLSGDGGVDAGRRHRGASCTRTGGQRSARRHRR